MFKKLNMLLCIAVLSLGVVGCSNTSAPKPESDKLDTELPEVETATTTPEPAKVYFDDTFVSSIKDYACKFTFVKAEQEMFSYSILNDKKENNTSVAYIDLDVDLASQITLTSMSTNFLDSEPIFYYFADDNKNNIHLSSLDDGSYIESDKLSSNLAIDYSKVINTYDFVEFMANGQLPSSDTLAVVDDKTYTFTTSREATEEDLTGTEYDKLGTTTVDFVVVEDEEGNLVPTSIEMNTTFFIGQIEYGVATVCTFSEYSTNTISMPEYATIEALEVN